MNRLSLLEGRLQIEITEDHLLVPFTTQVHFDLMLLAIIEREVSKC